jgi:hypothetical protein
MGQFERLQHHVFGQLVGAGLDHEDIVIGTGNHQIQAAQVHLLGCRIDHILAVDKADGRGRNRAVPRNVADGQRSRGSDDRQRVHQILAVGAERVDDDLHFVAHALGKERAQRAIHQAGKQNRLLAGTAFTTEETAGDATRSIESFFKFNRHGEEVHPRSNVVAHGGHSHQHRIAVAHGHGAACLCSQNACFDAQRTSTDLGGEDLSAIKHLHCFILLRTVSSAHA